MIIKNMRKICSFLALMLIIGTSLSCENENLFLFTNGTDVTNYWSFGTQATESLWSNTQFGAFLRWSSSWHFPGKYGTFTFKAATIDNISIGISTVNPWSVLSSGENLYTNLLKKKNFYGLFVGTWGSVIYKGNFSEEYVKLTSRGLPLDHPTGLAIQMLIEYKIILYRNTKYDADALAVFCLNPNNQQWQKLIEYRRPEFSEGPRWFSLSSWDRNVNYTNIDFSTSTQLPGKYLQQ